MAIGTTTVVSSNTVPGKRTVRFTQQLSTGADHVEAGSALDLSAATLGAYNGFHSQVDSCYMVGYTTDPGGDTGYLPVYVRAASGATTTGVLRVFVTGAAADSALSSAPANTNLSGVVVMMEATGI